MPTDLFQPSAGRTSRARRHVGKAHPLADAQGKARVSRLILWDRHDGVCPPCSWCGVGLTWPVLCADHVDNDHLNDDPANIVAACFPCNVHRMRSGRVGDKSCEQCGVAFYPDKPRRKFCQPACFYEHRRNRKVTTP